MAVDFKKAKEEALQEVEKETFEMAKDHYKYKMSELKKAEKVGANIKREIEDLEDELSQD